MKNGPMKASAVRSLLSFFIVILIGATIVGFYFGLQQVKNASVEVSHTAADANASGKSIDELQKLKSLLLQSQTLVNKANQLFSTPDAYQSQALKDVQKYATDAGLTISNTDFDVEEDKSAAASINASKPFAITLEAPVSYAKLLTFLDAIEGNLPKMQVTSIELSRPTAAGADNVKIGDIKIVVSTR